MYDQIAFLNEWGNDELDFTKKQHGEPVASTHFIVTALVVAKQDLPGLERVFKSASSKYFENESIDSQYVDNNHELRKLILSDILSEPVRIFALVVDKRQLPSEGLRHKGSVYKFLNELADRELFSIFKELEMVGKPSGPNSFINGFIKHTHENHIPDLFNQSTFGFVNTQADVVVEAAGFIAGTLAYCYDETVITDQRQDFVQLIQPSLIAMKVWPDVFAPYLIKVNSPQFHYNEGLANLSVNLANGFLNRKSNNRVPHVVDQITCLAFLIFHFRHISPTRYISSFEIMEQIRVRRGKTITLHYFQTKVIAPLRDAGVLIASSSRGYKLPSCESDLYDFINHSNTIVAPMLARIKKFRDQINRATQGSIDVLDRDEFSVIRKVIE